MKILVAALLLGLPAASSAGDSGGNTLPLKLVADVPLSGRTTRWDYESYDAVKHLLFIAHLGDGVVTVVNTSTQNVVADIGGIGHVHGVLVIPELDRVYASATQTDEVVAIDETTLKIVARIPGGTYPDGMAYAPDVHKLYVSDETGGTETVMDVRSNARTATIPLGGATGNTQYDPLSRHIFVNVQSRGELVEIDPQTEKIVARHALPGAKGNHGLLIEPGLGLAFIGCEGNDKLLVFDLGSKRVTAAFEVGAAPDVLAFDPGLNRLYVASEEGIVTVFSAEGGVVRRAGEGFVGPNAHVVGVDPRTHRTYFPLKDVGGRSILRIMEPK